MTNRLIDMHCHILPGVDDGCGTMDEAIETIRSAVAQGIQGFMVTPHYHPERFMVTAPVVKEKLEELKEECRKQKLSVALYPGQECYYYSELGEKLDSGEVATLNGSRYVLLEFEPDVLFSTMQLGIRDIQGHGYRVVLAHMERYRCLKDMHHLRMLKNRQVLLQMNYDTLCIRDRLFRKTPWRRIVQEGLVDYLGSDSHGMNFRPYHVDQALRWLNAKVDEDICEDMLYRNVRRFGINEKNREP